MPMIAASAAPRDVAIHFAVLRAWLAASAQYLSAAETAGEPPEALSSFLFPSWSPADSDAGVGT